MASKQPKQAEIFPTKKTVKVSTKSKKADANKAAKAAKVITVASVEEKKISVPVAIIQALDGITTPLDVHELTRSVCTIRGINTPLPTIRVQASTLAKKNEILRASHGKYLPMSAKGSVPDYLPKKALDKPTKAPKEVSPTPPLGDIKVGSWVRFTRDATLVVSVVQYVKQKTVITDLGAVHISNVLEVR